MKMVTKQLQSMSKVDLVFRMLGAEDAIRIAQQALRTTVIQIAD